MAYGRRHLDPDAWHYCMRCDKKKLINQELTWQRGLLLCRQCFDDPSIGLLGQRDVLINQVLQDGKNEQELAPLQKLRDPELEETTDDLMVI